METSLPNAIQYVDNRYALAAFILCAIALVIFSFTKIKAKEITGTAYVGLLKMAIIGCMALGALALVLSFVTDMQAQPANSTTANTIEVGNIIGSTAAIGGENSAVLEKGQVFKALETPQDCDTSIKAGNIQNAQVAIARCSAVTTRKPATE